MFHSALNLFGGTRWSFVEVIERATSDKNERLRWDHISSVCTLLNEGASYEYCLQLILGRMNDSNDLVVMQAVTLLDVCFEKCGSAFRYKFFRSKECLREFDRIAENASPSVLDHMDMAVKKWNRLYSLTIKRPVKKFESNSDVKATTSSQSVPTLEQLEEDDVNNAIKYSLKNQIEVSQSTPMDSLTDSNSNIGNSHGSAPTLKPSLECPICMDCDETAVVVAAQCGHMYHHECILRWLRSSDVCPNCRVEISGEALLKVYVPLTTSVK